MSHRWLQSCVLTAFFVSLFLTSAAFSVPALAYQPGGARGGPRPDFIPEDYNDQQHMREQLGIKALRPGKSGGNQTGEGFDEATSAKWLHTLPDLMTMKDGTQVTTPEQWEERRTEIVEDFEREIYGRIPDNVPKVSWEVTSTTEGMSGEIPTVTKVLVGRVDNSAFPQITVNIAASFTVPKDATAPVPIMINFGGGGGGFGGGRGARRGAAARGNAPERGQGAPATAQADGAAARGDAPARGEGAGAAAQGGGAAPRRGRGRGPGGGGPNWTQIAISKGWGYGNINPGSIQADSGGNALRQGIIGLTNKGEPRKPEDWGALRAWQWGVSRLIDYFEANPDAKVDATKVGIEGVSRYGKAALVTGAFEPRVAVAFVASSGAGGAKLMKRDFGESVENLTAGGEYHWMAGNYLKYGASEATFGSMNAGDLPVDAHQLIALCAPRLCFVTYGIESQGDPKWVDAHGSYMAAILAGPAYRLLGKKDLGVTDDYQTAPMPALDQVVGAELAWRQHSVAPGHSSGPSYPAFFEWVSNYIPAPPLPPQQAAAETPAEPAEESEVPTVRAIPRTDANSVTAHEQLLAKAKQGRIDVYFIGDSITRRWGATDYPQFLANWKESFSGWNAADFAWGGDRVENMLWRLENGELDGVNPKVIVIQGGTNNIGRRGGDATVAQVTDGLKAIIALCRGKAPGATIILTGVFPRNDNPNANATVERINEELAKLADGKTLRYLNINDKLADGDGRLHEGMAAADRLHLDLGGYQVWAGALKPMLTELLGPPAEVDLAPPATGDPSAAR